MPEITIVAISILAFSISLLSLMLLLSEYRKSAQLRQKEANIELQKAQDKSQQVISEAVKKAQSIISQAEIDELKIVNQAQLQTKKWEESTQQEFNSNAQVSKQQFNEEIKNLSTALTEAQKNYLNFLDTLKSDINKTQQDSLELVKQQTNRLFEKFEQNLADFLTSTEQKSVMTIELELRATRQLIDNYRQQQLKLIDENIVAILENTLTKVLSKKLSLKDQIDLVYDALEKAKLEKFIT